MGLEVGWVTRHSTARTIEVLVQTSCVDQILDQLAPDEGWLVEVEEAPRGDKLYERLVRLTRGQGSHGPKS